MKIKIESEGIGHNTKVTLEDGTILENCYYARWECDAQNIGNVTLKFRNVPAMVQGYISEEDFNEHYLIEDVTQFGDDSVRRAIVKRKEEPNEEAAR